MSKIRATKADKQDANWVAGVILEGAGTIPQLHFGPQGLAPQDLSAVAKGIRDGKIVVAFHDDPTQNPSALKSGIIVLQRMVPHGGLTFYKGTVIHEAVHVAFDLQGSKHPFVMSSVEDETAAFVVEAIFLRRHGVLATSIVSNEFLAAAYHAAGAMIGGANKGREINQLRQLVLDRYGNTPRDKNGLGR